MNNHKDSIILGIESSCDDTSAAILINGVIYSNITANQAVHEKYGGVVPELASRAHQENIIPVVSAALEKAKIKISDISVILKHFDEKVPHVRPAFFNKIGFFVG